MIDKLELWIGTLGYYLEKIAPYMITGVMSVVLYQLFTNF